MSASTRRARRCLPSLGRVALALTVGAALAACSPDKTAGEKVDDAVNSSQQQGAETKADLKQGAEQLQSAASATVNAVTGTASDASITTAVNAALVKDPALSALKIDVDTHDGRVVLQGTAPDSAARERATELAKAVSGVQSVDNQLVAKP